MTVYPMTVIPTVLNAALNTIIKLDDDHDMQHFTVVGVAYQRKAAFSTCWD